MRIECPLILDKMEIMKFGKFFDDNFRKSSIKKKLLNTTCIITECCLRLLGHILRSPPQELTYISLLATPCDG